MAEEKTEVKLSDLLDTITTRLKDAINDMETAIRCIEQFKGDEAATRKCIIEYLEAT